MSQIFLIAPHLPRNCAGNSLLENHCIFAGSFGGLDEQFSRGWKCGFATTVRKG
jgi:hypothetical protein